MGRKIPKISPDIISSNSNNLNLPSYSSDLVKTLPQFKPLAGRLKLDLNGNNAQRRRQMLMMRSFHIGGKTNKKNQKNNFAGAHHLENNKKQNFIASIPYKQRPLESDLVVEGNGNKNNRRMLVLLKNRENKDLMETAPLPAAKKNVQQNVDVIPKLKILRKVVKKVVSTPPPPTMMLLSKSSNSEDNFVEV